MAGRTLRKPNGFFLFIYPKGPYGRSIGVGVKKEKEKAYGGNTFKEINGLLEMS